MPSNHQKIVPVILSGGTGTRLWPLSRDNHPKQFIGIMDVKTPIIQETIVRILDDNLFHQPLMVGNDAHRFMLAEQMKRCGIAEPKIIIEPSAHNTAPAITAAALYVQQHYGNALMLILPTDHIIGDTDAFLDGIHRAASAAQKGYLVTFGIQPDHPETGYGYIQRGNEISDRKNTFQVSSFAEKPDAATAERFLAEGNYLWNSGMFMFPAELMLDEMQNLQPDLVDACREALSASTQDNNFIRLQESAFERTKNISIDYALMEATRRAAVVALDCGWSDTGAWDLLWSVSPKDGNGNAVFGECYTLDSHDCYMRSENGPAIATLGVDNLVVIATKDAVMVTHKDKAQSLKKMVAHVRQRNPDLVQENQRVYRPWGAYERIHGGERFQVKRLTVKPGEKLSLQMHYHRAEHWIVVAGTARMTCDDITKVVTENESFYIPCGSVHSIENSGKINLDIIEVQTGSYLGEDDIVRLSDIYGRIKT
ncbi:MAG TPA: mannose-1-phosphate guanylyltransferase/mannose-6-phosphate isomerase [Alphaproteobacteria bacterium]|nr:mannose-1-phosphate guanylyltransferase/mannose-6-phosphate isomerase [Rhodospirillaceae bacterium]HRJ11782.1 mannose-1-phosphate guanylyltransferase/mannose-6-phosphate isomerase [Alphaproteobacteria bacterium]